jgi:hypothetical protein
MFKKVENALGFRDNGGWGIKKKEILSTSNFSPTFQNPTITPSGRKVTKAEEREKKKNKKMPLIVDS